jgi:hypothetical protein
MSNGRSTTGKRTRVDTNRDPGGHVAMPWSVLDSAAYQGLSHPARALLFEFARQLGRGNNGQLLATEKRLRPRGWKSQDVITRALRELLATGLVHQTVKGQRPHRASWYAVTWYALADHQDYDVGAAQAFRRMAYLDTRSPALQSPLQAPSKPLPTRSSKNAVLTPSGGVERPTIAPSGGVEASKIAPPDGAIKGVFGTSSTPPDGDLLDIAISAGHSKKETLWSTN